MNYFYANEFQLETPKNCVMLLVICELSWWYIVFLMKEIRLQSCLLDMVKSQVIHLFCLARVAVVLPFPTQKTSLKLPGFLKSLVEPCLAWALR